MDRNIKVLDLDRYKKSWSRININDVNGNLIEEPRPFLRINSEYILPKDAKDYFLVFLDYVKSISNSIEKVIIDFKLSIYCNFPSNGGLQILGDIVFFHDFSVKMYDGERPLDIEVQFLNMNDEEMHFNTKYSEFVNLMKDTEYNCQFPEFQELLEVAIENLGNKREVPNFNVAFDLHENCQKHVILQFKPKKKSN